MRRQLIDLRPRQLSLRKSRAQYLIVDLQTYEIFNRRSILDISRSLRPAPRGAARGATWPIAPSNHRLSTCFLLKGG